MTLREPADLLAIVPYLLGFHPQDSLVLLGVRHGALAFQARTDLPGSAGTEPVIATRLLDVVARQDVDAVLLVGYGPAARTDPLVTAVRRACGARGLAVPEALRAHEGRFWSYGCADPHCCPAGGTPYDVSTTAVAAAATVAGCVALPDRATFARQVEPLGGPARDRMRAATDRAASRLVGLLDAADDPRAAVLDAGRSALAAALERVGGSGAGAVLSDDEVAWLTLLLVGGGPVGEHAWRALRRAATPTPGRSGPGVARGSVRGTRPADGRDGGGHVAAAHRRLWQDVVPRCEPELVATPATLLAWVAWQEGEGILASVAVDRALRVDPGHRRARQLDALLRDGTPPPDVRAPRRARRSRSVRVTRAGGAPGRPPHGTPG